MTYLYEIPLKISTIRTYLSGVKSTHILNGSGIPSMEECPRLQMALRAIEMASDAPKPKLPITLAILKNVKCVMSDDYNNEFMWAAMTLGMFGLLRAAEFTVTHVSGFHPDINMTSSYVLFSQYDSGSNFMTIHLKRTKTCRNTSGVNIIIGCTEMDVSALCAMKLFLNDRLLFESGGTIVSL